MFYDPRDGHGLPHNPLKSLIVPRPIGWISTLSPDGVPNLAPYSFFQCCSEQPPMVLFCPVTDTKRAGAPADFGKDSRRNAEATGEFVVNMATWDQREAMNVSNTAVAPDVNEFDLAGLEMQPSARVKPPRVQGAPVHLECTYWKTIELPQDRAEFAYCIVIGTVVGIHIEDWALTDGLVDIARLKPIARMGYQDYTVVDQTFRMPRPGQTPMSPAAPPAAPSAAPSVTQTPGATGTPGDRGSR